jgi:hypothetical protein
MAKGSNRLKGAINVSGKHVLELKAMSDKASKSWRWVAFRNDPFKRKSINALFKKREWFFAKQNLLKMVLVL